MGTHSLNPNRVKKSGTLRGDRKVTELLHFAFWVMIALAGTIAFAIGLDSRVTWRRTHKQLNLRIRKLDDGRFYVSYYWSAWESIHEEYVSAELFPAYISELAIESLKVGNE